MKDYYYFLGIEPEATREEIKKAFRKLSLKYHPDKNENDEFFANRFKEILEAYDVLMDDDKKKIYDQNYVNLKHKKSILPPKIVSFTSSKIRAKKGEELVIYWQTYDADMVKFVPFGLEKSSGERRFTITDFDKDGKFQILLHATNSLLHKTIVKGLVITELKDVITNEDKVEKVENLPTRDVDREKYYKTILLFVALFIVMVLIWVLIN